MAASVLVMALAAAVLLRFCPGHEGSAFHKVAKNSLFPLATSFLNKFLDLGFAVYTFRVLGVEGVGAYALAQVVLGYLDIVANFGLGTLLTREVAKDRLSVDRFLGNTLALRVGLWLLSVPFLALLLGPGAGFMGITPQIALAIALLVAGLLPSLVAGTISALFQAYERFEYPAIVTVLTTVLKIGLGVAALVSGWGFVGLAGVSVVVNLITMGVLFALMLALLVRPHWGFDAGFSWKLLGVSYPLMLNNLLNSVFYRVDSLMLTPMAGSTALGFYSTAYKFIDGLGIISSTFTMALFPLLSQYAHDARGPLARAFGLAMKLLLMASLPISVGTTLVASQIILLFAGEEYLPHSAIALQILVWFLPFSFVNGVTQYLLIAINQQRFITLSFVIAAAFNVVANLVLIPTLGYVGAALTTVASELVLMVPFWYCVRLHVPPIPVFSLAWRPVVASAIMGLEVWLLRDWNVIAAIVVAVPVYGAALLALGSFDKGERAMIASMLPRRFRTDP